MSNSSSGDPPSGGPPDPSPPAPAPNPSGPNTAVSARGLKKVLDDGNEAAVTAVRLNDVLSGRYRLEQKIGEGGMGTVYLAVDVELDRKVAVKLLAKNLVGDAEVVERFEREARLTARLDHPHIVPIYDVGRHQERPFIVMKKLEGDTLADVLRQKGGLTPDETLALIKQLAAGLDFIHGKGFIHRDIKAGNIFVGPEGHATILDFGILRSTASPGSLTRTGMVMGTPHYMAPEQALGSKDVDHRVDLYALAVVAFECLTGTLPFEADSELRLIQMQAHSPPPDVLERAPWISRPIAEMMKKALAKRPEERFSTGAELLAALQVAYAAGKAGVPAFKATPATPAVPTQTAPSLRKLESGAPVALPQPPAGPDAGRRGWLRWGVLGATAAATAVLVFSRPWGGLPVGVETPAPDAGLPLLAEVPDAGEAEEDAGADVEVDAGEADAGKKRTAPPPPKRGKLNVITTFKGEPFWAEVAIDGTPRGRTPLQLELPVGTHQVRVERPGFRTEVREIKVGTGKPAVVPIDLTQ